MQAECVQVHGTATVHYNHIIRLQEKTEHIKGGLRCIVSDIGYNCLIY